MSSVPVLLQVQFLATDQHECLYLKMLNWVASRGETLFTEQHCGGFSQLTHCQSAVKQLFCSLCSICRSHSERWHSWPRAPCPAQLLLPSTRGSSTQRCLPFMGWNLGGKHRGDGVTPSATTLIYCIHAGGRREAGENTASIYAWMYWLNSTQMKIAFSAGSNLI